LFFLIDFGHSESDVRYISKILKTDTSI